MDGLHLQSLSEPQRFKRHMKTHEVINYVTTEKPTWKQLIYIIMADCAILLFLAPCRVLNLHPRRKTCQRTLSTHITSKPRGKNNSESELWLLDESAVGTVLHFCSLVTTRALKDNTFWWSRFRVNSRWCRSKSATRQARTVAAKTEPRARCSGDCLHGLWSRIPWG